jgi:hypothetical protein
MVTWLLTGWRRSASRCVCAVVLVCGLRTVGVMVEPAESRVVPVVPAVRLGPAALAQLVDR